MAAEDIGAVAAAVFDEGDPKAPFSIAMPTWIFRKVTNDEMVIMLEWFRDHAHDWDMETIRTLHPSAWTSLQDVLVEIPAADLVE